MFGKVETVSWREGIFVSVEEIRVLVRGEGVGKTASQAEGRMQVKAWRNEHAWQH